MPLEQALVQLRETVTSKKMAGTDKKFIASTVHEIQSVLLMLIMKLLTVTITIKCTKGFAL